MLQLRADLEDPQNVGAAPLGMRRIMYFKRGSFSGPALTGDILPGGGDWVLVRPDGVSLLDIRMTLRTDDGTLIYMNATGIFDMAPEVRARFNRGESVGPSEYCAYRKSNPAILMAQSAQDRMADNASSCLGGA